MNEVEMNLLAKDCEVNLNNNDSIDDPSLRERLKGDFSFLDVIDRNEDSRNEMYVNNQENISPTIDKNIEHDIYIADDLHKNKKLTKFKPLNKKDKVQLESDTQRIIRENASVELSYKPQKFKTIKELKEMLARNRENANNCRKPIGTGLAGTRETEERKGQTEPAAPIGGRINVCQNNETVRGDMLTKAKLLEKVDTVLRERYQRHKGNRAQLIELKSREQYVEDNRNAEAFMQKLRRNFLLNPERNGSVDFVIKEQRDKQLVEHHIVVKDTVKCVQLAGEIDPMLSKGVIQMLSEHEQQKLLTMSERDKWKKHRSLLLAAEAEKRKTAVDARRKEMGLLEGKLDQPGVAVATAGNADGLSDDDYEWKASESSDSDSKSGSATDRGGDGSDCSLSDDEQDDFGKQLRRTKRAIIDSEDEASPDVTIADDSNRDSSNLLGNLSNFIEIPSSEDLFAESQSFRTTASCSMDKSDILPAGFSLVVDQPGNRDWWNVHSVDTTTVLMRMVSNEAFVLDDTVVMERTAQQLDDTVVMECTAQQLDDTVVMERTAQQLDDTVGMERTAQQLDDTVVMERTAQQLDDTVVMECTAQQLDDTVVMERTAQQLDDTVVMERIAQQLDDTVVMCNAYSSVLDKSSTKIAPNRKPEGTLDSSLEMRSEHRKMFNFPSSGSSISANEESLSKCAALRSLKDLMGEDSEDEKDIDDVQLDDDEEEEDAAGGADGVDLDRDLDDDQLEQEHDRDDISIDTETLDSDDNRYDDDEEELLRKQVVAVARMVPTDFIDDEAELSGSDDDDNEHYGPDEDGSDLDRYEEEDEADAEKLPSEGRLRRQIEKIHNRLEIDKDARDIRYLKELYLEDGDLHIAGAGQRRRRYEWAAINAGDDGFGRYQIDADGDEQDDNSDEANNDQVDLDQSNADITAATGNDDEQEEGNEPLMERYGRHLHARKYVPRVQEQQHNAWQPLTARATLGSNGGTHKGGPTDSGDFMRPVQQKHGSLMNKISQLPPVNPNHQSTMSLKSRMQQHTFTVQSKQSATKRQPSNANEELGNDASKKQKF